MNFTQFLQVLKARKAIVLTVFTVVVLTTLGISMIMPKRYTAELVMSIDSRGLDAVTGQPINTFLTPAYLATQVDTINSHNVALKVVDQLGLANSAEARQRWEDAGGEGNFRDYMADSLMGKLEVKPSRDSNMITISYTSPDPHYASVVANAFGAAYQKILVDIRSANAQQNNDFFQQQLKGLKSDMDRAQQRLTEFQQKEGISATDERMDIETQRLNDLAAQLGQAQSATLDAQSRARGGVSSPDVLNNGLIQNLKGTLASQEAQFKQMQESNGPNYPKYKEMEAQVQATRDQLNQLLRQYSGSVNSVAANSASRQAAVENAMAEQKARVMDLKKRRATMDALTADVENAQKAYAQAQQRSFETMLQSRNSSTDYAILKSAPEPNGPSGPRVFMNTLLAVVVGLLLGISFAWLAEVMNRRVRSAMDVELLLDVPVLADLRKTRRLRRPRPPMLNGPKAA